jgi:transcriptional regulator
MYVPAHFEETRVEVMHRLMAEHPLAAVVTVGSDGLDANHIPLELEPQESTLGILRGHVARANPLWRDFSQDLGALALFQGPQTYVSPNWYPTKAETGKVVPTWNYIVVHARGPLRIIEDRNWLRSLVGRLTDRHEAAAGATPWKVSDAPEDFIEKQLGAIVGIEITITKMTGKWKTSQNRNVADREGVASALAANGSDEARAMAKFVSDRKG